MTSEYKNIIPEDAVANFCAAFTGTDKPAEARHCLLWFRDGKVRAAFVDYLPTTFTFDEQKYQLVDAYVGDWEPLLTNDGLLAGFGFLGFVEYEQELLNSRLLSQSSNVEVRDGMIFIRLLEKVPSNMSSGVCAMGTRIYRGQNNDYMFCLPQWTDWGKINFQIEAENIPVSN